MPEYNFVVWNKCSRVKYPKSFDLPDVEAARYVATKIARVFGEVVPRWDELTYDQQNNFAVEVVDETGHTVLTVPCKEAEERARQWDRGDEAPSHKEAPPRLLN